MSHETQINLSWTDTTSDETAFYIERSPDGSTGWTEIGTVSANVTTYSDTTLTCGTPYFYRVRGYRSADSSYSVYSNTANASTIQCAPDLLEPANGSLTNHNQPTLRWSTVSTAAMYRVQVDNNADFSSITWDQLTAATSFTPPSPLLDNVTYHWRAQAINAGGDSGDWSAVWQFTVDPLRPPMPKLTLPKDRKPSPTRHRCLSGAR